MPTPKEQSFEMTEDLMQVAFQAVRDHADKSQYGRYISDEECRSVAQDVMTAIENYEEGK